MKFSQPFKLGRVKHFSALEFNLKLNSNCQEARMEKYSTGLMEIRNQVKLKNDHLKKEKGLKSLNRIPQK